MRRGSLPLVGLLILVLAAGGTCRVDAQRAGGVTETRLQAAIVTKLVQFVDWPPGALDGRSSVELCVAGGGAFAQDLQELEAGEMLKGLPVNVRRVEGTREIDGCHALVLPAGTVSRTSRLSLIRKASSLPTLTLSDDNRFLDDGGIVRLRMVDGHPRFDIDDAAARRVGLRISSRLLGLAATVLRGPS